MLYRNIVSFSLIGISILFAVAVYTFLPNIFVAYTGAKAERPGQVGLEVAVRCVDGTPTTHLDWSDPNNAREYTVFRNPNKSGVGVWGPIDYPKDIVYADTSIAIGKSYKYQIRATSPAGVEKYSSVVAANTISCPIETKQPDSKDQPASSPIETPAAPPQRITFNPSISTECVQGDPQVRMSWTNPNGAESFNIFRIPNVKGDLLWGRVGTADATSYTDKPLEHTSYRYQIQAPTAESTRYSDILPITTLSCDVQAEEEPVIDEEQDTVPPAHEPSTSTPPASTTPSTPQTSAASSTMPTPQKKKYVWGVYSGWYEGDIKQFETIVGENPDIIAAFTHWGNANAFPVYLSPFAKDKDRTLLIFWEASNHNIASTEQSAFSYDAILAGNWDSYIKSFAAQAKTYGGPVILVPFSEANGNWSPWSGVKNGNTPEKAVLAYRHVRTTFGDLPNVKFGWAPNSNSVPDTAENAIEKYYPGDAYVDYVGVDGFNFNDPWVTFDQIFKKPLTLLSTYNKPIYIFSFASAAGPKKAAWITDALTTQLAKYPLVEGWNWFNQNKEENWLIWSDTESLAAFKEIVQLQN